MVSFFPHLSRFLNAKFASRRISFTRVSPTTSTAANIPTVLRDVS